MQLTATFSSVQIVGVEEPDDGMPVAFFLLCDINSGMKWCLQSDKELELYFLDVDENKVFGAGEPHHRTYTDLKVHCDEG